MGKRTVEILECDICGRESKVKEDVAKWLQWSQDHPFIDRNWIERAACPECVEDIQTALNNKVR